MKSRILVIWIAVLCLSLLPAAASAVPAGHALTIRIAEAEGGEIDLAAVEFVLERDDGETIRVSDYPTSEPDVFAVSGLEVGRYTLRQTAGDAAHQMLSEPAEIMISDSSVTVNGEVSESAALTVLLPRSCPLDITPESRQNNAVWGYLLCALAASMLCVCAAHLISQKTKRQK